MQTQAIDRLSLNAFKTIFLYFILFFLFYNKGQYHRQELILSKQSDCLHHNWFSKTLNHLRCQAGKNTRKKEDKYKILINHFLNVKRKRWYRIVNTQEERYMCALYKSNDSHNQRLTSGAIHRYVPVSAVITPDWAFTLATPKSATLTTCHINPITESFFLSIPHWQDGKKDAWADDHT